MDNKGIIEDEIEILDDIAEEEVLLVEEPTSYQDKTYVEDNSLKDNGEILVSGVSDTVEHTVDDALTKFNTEEVPNVVEEVVAPEEQVIESVVIGSEGAEAPTLSDELDNTLMLAKQAIKPETISDTKPMKDETKSNKRSIIFVIVIFVLLGLLVVALPTIINLFK